MKKLFLIRHAKSSWKEAKPDFERGLNRRGKVSAKFMGEKLLSRGAAIDLLIASAAKRTQKTTQLLNDSLNLSSDAIEITEELYLASPREIISMVKRQDASVNELAIVGHNPGITAALNRLSGEHFENMPTCSIGCIIFDVDSWEDIEDSGKLGFFIYPKMFKQLLEK